MSNSKIYVVMRNHNAYGLTKTCLLSLLDCSYRNLNIVVIDDGSKDGSGERLAVDFPEIVVITSIQYVEYCKGLNLGIRYALKNDADFVFVVNNDTDNFSNNYFESLLAGFSSVQNVGLVGSLVYDYEGNQRWDGVAKARLGVYVDTPTEGYMLSSEVLQKVGLLDEQLVRYFEDYDYLIRMRAQGFESLCVTDVSFDHLGGGTSKKQLFVPNYYRVRNLIWFLKRYRRDESFGWKYSNFRGFMRKHIMLLVNHVKSGEIIKAACVGLSISAGLFVGTFSSWDNDKYE